MQNVASTRFSQTSKRSRRIEFPTSAQLPRAALSGDRHRRIRGIERRTADDRPRSGAPISNWPTIRCRANHAVLESVRGEFVLTDLDSTNGTYVNDQRIDARQLNPGDRLRFGNQIFKFLSADRIEAEYHETVYDIMTTDGMTQAHSKRYLMEVVERELHRTQRTHRPLSLLMIDVDRFKDINDTFGHLTGDEVLIELCRRATGQLRRDEVLARYGGEEFVLVMADTPLSRPMKRPNGCGRRSPIVRFRPSRE